VRRCQFVWPSTSRFWSAAKVILVPNRRDSRSSVGWTHSTSWREGRKSRKFLICRATSSSAWRVPAGWFQVGEVHQHQIITVALVTTNSFIVVQKIAAAI